MILHPFLSLTVQPDETPGGFCSRIARKVGHTARGFTGHIGTTFQMIVDGAADAIDLLARTCGVDSATFERTTLVRTGDRTYDLAGQEFTRETLTRGNIHVCPVCIAEDLAGPDGKHGPYGRSRWQIEAIRICLQHGCLLVPLGHDENPHMTHDFAWHVSKGLKTILGTPVMAMPEGSDGLARHLTRRLDGTEPESWLSTMPAYAAAKSCEIVGLSLRHGVHAPWKSMTAADWHLAGSEGHKLLSSGPAALVEYLSDLRKAAPVAEFGLRRIYGRLFDYLSHDNQKPAFEPMRAVLRDHLLESNAFAAGDIVLGKVVETRRLHSVRSLGQETGMDVRTLRRRLTALGIIETTEGHLPNDRLIFDAQTNAPLVDKVVGAIDRPAAERYLGIKRTQTFLLNAPFLAPFWTEGLRPVEHLFLKSDLDAFLAMLTKRAKPLMPDDKGFHRIGKAASRCKRPPQMIAQLLLLGRLRNVRTDPDSAGVDAIMVDVAEVKAFLSPMSDLLTIRMLMAELRCDQKIARALMVTGALPARFERHPINRLKCWLAHVSDVETFKAEYVSVYILAEEVGMHFRLLKEKLIDMAIPTAFDPKEVGTLFYRRSELLPFMHRLRA